MMKRILTAICIALLTAACTKNNDRIEPKAPETVCEKVLLLYLDGYNNLPMYMEQNITEISPTAPSKALADKYRLLVYSHFTASQFDYKTPAPSYLECIWTDNEGNPVRDTLVTYPDTCNSASAQMLNRVLTDVRNLVPAEKYGLLVSSHGTGWLPDEYYTYGNRPDPYYIPSRSLTSDFVHPLLLDPVTKSIGSGAHFEDDGLAHEYTINITDLAAAIPYKLDYFLIDACLMGGVETAWELKDITGAILFSQSEIMSDGFAYDKLLERVLYSDEPDFRKVCDDVIDRNNGTISYIRTDGLDRLAEVCAGLFDKYADNIAKAPYDDIQGFFRFGKCYFYDMRDILVKSGISDYDLKLFDDALGGVVQHVRYTEYMLGMIFSTDCGMTMYLPAKGTPFLDDYYRTLGWNRATHLVR